MQYAALVEKIHQLVSAAAEGDLQKVISFYHEEKNQQMIYSIE